MTTFKPHWVTANEPTQADDVPALVNRFYATLRPRYLDLLMDVGAAELFLIEGDALLLRVVQDPLVDARCILHVVYSVEKILQSMRSRGAYFRVVFFKTHEAIWAHSPLMQLVRRCVVEHLKRHTEITVDMFDAWHGDHPDGPETPNAWQDYLLRREPSFILCHEGEEKDNVPAHVALNPDVNSKELLRLFLVDCLTKDFHCVFAADISESHNTVSGFVVRSSSDQFFMSLYADLYDAYLAAHHPHNALPAEPTPPAPLDSPLASTRASLVAQAVVATLAALPAGLDAALAQDLARVALLATALAENLPLALRAQAFAGDASTAHLNALPAFADALCVNLAASVVGVAQADAEPQAFADLYDGRFLCRLLAIATAPEIGQATDAGDWALPAPATDAYTALAAAAGLAPLPLLAAPASAVMPLADAQHLASVATLVPEDAAAAGEAHVCVRTTCGGDVDVEAIIRAGVDDGAAGAGAAAPGDDNSDADSDADSDASSDDSWEQFASSSDDDSDDAPPARGGRGNNNNNNKRTSTSAAAEARAQADRKRRLDAAVRDAELSGPMAPASELLLPVHNAVVSQVLGDDVPPHMSAAAALPVSLERQANEFFEEYGWRADIDLHENYDLQDEVAETPKDPENISWLDAAYEAIQTYARHQRTRRLADLLTIINNKGIKALHGSSWDTCLSQLTREVEEDIKINKKNARFMWHKNGETVKVSRKHIKKTPANTNQKYISFLHKYAQSLEGTTAMHDRSIILYPNAEESVKARPTGWIHEHWETKRELAEKRERAEKEKHDAHLAAVEALGGGNAGKDAKNSKKKDKKKKKKGGKKGKGPSAAEIKLQNTRVKNRERLQNSITQWRQIVSQHKSNSNHDAVIEAIKRTFIEHCDVPHVACKATMYTIHRMFRKWKDSCYEAPDDQIIKTSAQIQIAVDLFRACFSAIDVYGPPAELTPHAENVLDLADLTAIVHVMSVLGLPEVGQSIRDRFESAIVAAVETTRKEAAETAAALGIRENENLLESAFPNGRGGFGDVDLFADDDDNNSHTASAVDFTVGMSWARFQLMFQGHLMERQRGLIHDERCHGFTPDDWQRRLLNIVDQNESALISAPTSSGKTFISFYCMEQVLRSSHDGVLVYIAPTRALVNQVAADVYARFGNKEYPSTHAGCSVFGVMTGKYRYKALRCQILITIPSCLEELLMSPQPQVRDWVSRLQYCIFDEVHSINKDNGSVWERLLLLIRCPFLALSATIGNPGSFIDWLSTVQQYKRQQELDAILKRGLTKKEKKIYDNGRGAEKLLTRRYEVTLIEHSVRWADLRKYVFLPRVRAEDDKLEITGVHRALSPEDEDEFVELHPCATLTYQKLSGEEGFPRNLTFEPIDALDLYDRMLEEKPDAEQLLGELCPETYFFPPDHAMRRFVVRSWEHRLKDLLVSWVRSGDEQAVANVLSYFSAPVSDNIQNRVRAAAELDVSIDTEQYLHENVVELVTALSSLAKLPAILFSFSQETCEELAVRLVDALVDAEEASKDSDAARREAKRIERANAKAAKAAKRARDKKRTKKDEEEELMEGDTAPEIIDADAIDQAFSFAQFDGSSIEEGWLRANLRFLGNASLNIDPRLIEGLRRGIGVHHAGLPRKYREMVEMLFRAQFLKVVVATHTLALGIHMPCKTVVFAGDSVHLDSLQYRQMSGRAGRRGYDPLGNVIFFGLPLQKINRLVSAQTPSLRAHYPMSDTLVLRLLTRFNHVQHQLTLAGGDDQEIIQDMLHVQQDAQRLIEAPFFCMDSDANRMQVREHFRYACQFLARDGLIGSNGQPIGLGKLAAHLHVQDPTNLAFSRLLRDGIFHEIATAALLQAQEAAGDNQGLAVGAVDTMTQLEIEKQISRDLILLLCHMFERVPLHSCILLDPKLDDAANECAVVMPRLSEPILDAIHAYNERVISIYTSYLARAAQQQPDAEENLPASGISFAAPEMAATNQGLVAALHAGKVPFTARSPFVALSGHGDRFASADELAQTVRSGVYIDSGALPVIEVDNVLLNAFALDYWNTKSKHAIVANNGMNLSQVWNALNNLIGALRTALEAVEASSEMEDNAPAEDNFVAILSKTVEEYEITFHNLRRKV